MTAPGSVKLNENIDVVVKDDVLVVVRNHHMHWSFLLLRNGFRLDGWLNLALKHILDELANIVLGDLLVLIKGVLQVLDSLVNGKSRELIDLEVQIASVRTVSLGINGGNRNGTPVLLGHWPQHFCKLSSLLRSLSKDIGKGNAGLERVKSLAPS